MSIGATWHALGLRHGERTALIDHAGAWSYRQLQSRIARFANALRGLGLDRGDRVALLAPDIREYLEADYGIMSAGLVRVPLDPRATGADLVALIRHAGATALVTHASFAEKVAGLKSEGLRHLIMIGGDGGLAYEELLGRASDQALPPVDDDAIATLNFSGGTTGAPKAAMLRHRNLLAVARNVIQGFDIHPDSRFLNVRPLWPIAQVILMSHLLAGATVILRRFDPEQMAALVAESGATRTSLVPTQLVRCLDHLRQRDQRLTRLEAIYVGGSRIPPGVFARALDVVGAKIGVLYGLTEAPVTSYLPPQSLADQGARARLMHSVGRVLPEYQVRISDQAFGAAAGEVLIRGGNVMAGYWRDEAATAAALREGWLHTGDIGQCDDDGHIAIVGRIKEVIRSGSSTVIPKEVEDVIVLHPAVAEVAVIGLPDTEWGEAVTAFVVRRPGAPVTENDLMEHCRARLASYKKPRAIRFVASLPRSHYGKVLRAELIAQVAG
jgi:acyl-CoA synthetase (AMP-forming)/AMP-acid ligase II